MLYCSTHPHVQGFRGIDFLTAWQKKYKIECCTFLRPGKKIIEGRASTSHFKIPLADKFKEAEIFSMTSYNYLCTCDLYSPVHIVWMRAYPLRGEVGGGWALEFESFLGPVKWHRADRRVPFGAQKTPQIMDTHASKTLCTGLYKSLVHK
jgi:hypothetical protein